MSNTLLVNAQWDPKAHVWVATSEDIPGLVTEAESLDELLERVLAVTPELLDDNAHLLVTPRADVTTLDIRILSQVPKADMPAH